MDENMTPPPPVEFGELPEKPPSWPAAIGIINIVLASLGLICYGCGTLNTVATPWLVNLVPEGQRPATAQGVQLVIQIVQLCLSSALSVWLLIAGIGLLKRRAWARTNCIAWSLVKILLALAGSLVAVLLAKQTVQQINDQLSQQGSAPFTMTVPLFTALILVSLVWYLIWPVFLLIWFSRGKIADEVAAWAAEGRALV